MTRLCKSTPVATAATAANDSNRIRLLTFWLQTDRRRRRRILLMTHDHVWHRNHEHTLEREQYDSIRETDKRKMIKIKMFKRVPKVIHRIG